MWNRRYALITTIYALGLAGAIATAVFSGGSPTQEATPSKYSALVALRTQTIPPTPSDHQAMTTVRAEFTSYTTTVLMDEEAALRTLAAAQAEAQAHAAALRASGQTSHTSTTTHAPVTSAGNLPAIFSCIIQHESGGDPTAMNPSGAAGLFQDMPGTWDDYDGYPSAADAPVSVQYAFNEQLYAARGLGPWTGDPCVG